MKKFLLLLDILELSLMVSKTITSTGLNDALAKASTRDIIELKPGIHTSLQYCIKSSTKGNPITIKAQDGAKAVITGTSSSCIFDFYGVSFAFIEGTFELKDAFCGVKTMNVNSVKICELTVHNT